MTIKVGRLNLSLPLRFIGQTELKTKLLLDSDYIGELVRLRAPRQMRNELRFQ